MASPQRSIRRVESLQKEIEETFSELIHTRWAGTDKSWRPAIDFYETASEFLILGDLPGIPENDVQFSADETSVTICGKRQNMISISKGFALMSERASGKFCRTIHLPKKIDVNRAQAQFKNGVYEIVLPKAQ